MAKVSCSCNNLLRFCSDCYELVHKNNQGYHDSINLDEIKKELSQRIHSTEEEKLKSFKFSKNLAKIENQLQLNFNLCLQGHSNCIKSVVVTSDNKYVISGSADNNIIIWNFLEKRQEAILRGHTSWVDTLALTSDNKYVISGSLDKTIRIWNLLEKRQEAVLKGLQSRINCVAVTSDDK